MPEGHQQDTTKLNISTSKDLKNNYIDRTSLGPTNKQQWEAIPFHCREAWEKWV